MSLTLIAERTDWGCGLYRDYKGDVYYMTTWCSELDGVPEENIQDFIKTMRMKTCNMECVEENQLRGYLLLKKLKAEGK